MSEHDALSSRHHLALEGRPGVPADRIVVVSPVAAALAPTYLSPGSKGMPSTALIAFATGALGIVVTRTALRAAIPILGEMRRLKRSGFEVFPVSRTELTEIGFSHGHPRENVVYARHPLVGTRYYPVSTFHHFVFEHKAREVTRLLAALGAASFEVQYRTGWSTKFAGSLDLPIAQLKGSGKASVKGHKAARREFMLQATLDRSNEPHVPPDLVWFEHEPFWQEVADLRISKGLREFTLKLVYDDDFGVSADLAAAIGKNGRLDIAGSFESQENTEWVVSGRFGSSSRVHSSATSRGFTAQLAQEAVEMAMLEMPKRDLYRCATELKITGRSHMSKGALASAIVACSPRTPTA